MNRPARIVAFVVAACLVFGCTTPQPAPRVYTGGVAGVEALADPQNSKRYRALGGGLYLHNNGWHALDNAQRRAALAAFADAPVAIELGFHPIDGWPMLYRRAYLPFDIAPALIAVNCFDRNNLPTPDEWARYTAGLRAAGVGDDTRVLPTFEYANFGENQATLADNTLSRRDDFRAIVGMAGGIVLDTPPQYFFLRNQGYRDWVIDAIRWCNTHFKHVVVIVSPHQSGDEFRADTDRFLAYLQAFGLRVDAWVCENYEAAAPADYPNVVGNEADPASTLGVGRWLLGVLAEENSTD